MLLRVLVVYGLTLLLLGSLCLPGFAEVPLLWECPVEGTFLHVTNTPSHENCRPFQVSRERLTKLPAEKFDRLLYRPLATELKHGPERELAIPEVSRKPQISWNAKEKSTGNSPFHTRCEIVVSLKGNIEKNSSIIIRRGAVTEDIVKLVGAGSKIKKTLRGKCRNPEVSLRQ